MLLLSRHSSSTISFREISSSYHIIFSFSFQCPVLISLIVFHFFLFKPTYAYVDGETQFPQANPKTQFSVRTKESNSRYCESSDKEFLCRERRQYMLLSSLQNAIQIKCLEVVLCGSLVRLGLAQIFGRVLAKMFESTMEVYFMVTWFVFYFVSKSRYANQQGSRFGHREIKGLNDGNI
ncbi:uncharacterized protein LOC131654074 [Vicia villosa]|uniref:uncharacterized protein LOC131654074 n=1 Tax=Vicia villosa TaxID=3911 RepID=UPI00273C2D4D|nr:uncharacterized protein LOC131654074 [Vicia villosa]XP_058780470.1 uncharacterized protein LOC131654074 [Vicia villosa]